MKVIMPECCCVCGSYDDCRLHANVSVDSWCPDFEPVSKITIEERTPFFRAGQRLFKSGDSYPSGTDQELRKGWIHANQTKRSKK